ncbi:hypothetical protein Naga_100183g3 [Nannochloropsis gaditana]|uniref:Uncharacterized protein n=1 Tax=Nannochloropsis gaditana TaxID=72520 RepID=W7T5A3_9STRA|nr:hypothetical protein Naga_100183g3 [Nannochloropsis gaditana]
MPRRLLERLWRTKHRERSLLGRGARGWERRIGLLVFVVKATTHGPPRLLRQQPDVLETSHGREQAPSNDKQADSPSGNMECSLLIRSQGFQDGFGDYFLLDAALFMTRAQLRMNCQGFQVHAGGNRICGGRGRRRRAPRPTLFLFSPKMFNAALC